MTYLQFLFHSGFLYVLVSILFFIVCFIFIKLMKQNNEKLDFIILLLYKNLELKI